MKRIPPDLCARCKGYKRLCGLPRCPLLDSFRAQVQAASRAVRGRVEGSTPPGALVGEHGYPKVNLYYMIPPGVRGSEASYYEAPTEWAERRETLAGIIRLRSQLLSARLRLDARDPLRLYQDEIGLAALSEKPVDSEAILAKPPTPRLTFSGITKPRGPSAPAVRLVVEDNPRLDRRVEKAIWDDALAEDVAWELYRAGVDVYTIQRMLSLGFMGRLRSRRLVPTRWAITAVDDMISRRIRGELRGARQIDEYEVYFAEYLGNRFAVILGPGEGVFEWVEAWQPFTAWTRTARDVVVLRLEEDPLGRRTMDDGGYSAARLSVLEHLYSRGRVGDAVIVREVTPDYYAPVGNWHIRETVRRAMASGPLLRTSDPAEALREALSLLSPSAARAVSGKVRIITGRGRRRKITDFM